MKRGIIPLRRIAPPALCTGCPKQRRNCKLRLKYCRWTRSGHASRPCLLKKSKLMPDERINGSLNTTSDTATHPPQYHAMVLLVDDQAMVCEAVRRALANQSDIDFHYCAEAREALNVANQIKPTVILQDLVMPGIDGLSLVSQFRANPTTKETPIIVL